MLLDRLADRLQPCWSAVIFWAIDPRAAPLPDQSRTVKDLNRDVNPEVLVATARAANLNATEAVRRLARGSRCRTLLVDGEVATTCWISDRAEWLGELGRWFVPGEGEAYLWDCATRPAFQGGHLYSDLLRATLQDLADQGFRRVWIATEWQNWRSARGVSRAGFRPVGIAVSARLAGFRWEHLIADPTAPPNVVEALRAGLSSSSCVRSAERVGADR